MKFSRRSIDALLDLVEMKLSAMQVSDREDQREFAVLESARDELVGLKTALVAARAKPVLREAIAPEPAHA